MKISRLFCALFFFLSAWSCALLHAQVPHTESHKWTFNKTTAPASGESGAEMIAEIMWEFTTKSIPVMESCDSGIESQPPGVKSKSIIKYQYVGMLGNPEYKTIEIWSKQPGVHGERVKHQLTFKYGVHEYFKETIKIWSKQPGAYDIRYSRDCFYITPWKRVAFLPRDTPEVTFEPYMLAGGMLLLVVIALFIRKQIKRSAHEKKPKRCRSRCNG